MGGCARRLWAEVMAAGLGIGGFYVNRTAMRRSKFVLFVSNILVMLYVFLCLRLSVRGAKVHVRGSGSTIGRSWADGSEWSTGTWSVRLSRLMEGQCFRHPGDVICGLLLSCGLLLICRGGAGRLLMKGPPHPSSSRELMVTFVCMLPSQVVGAGTPRARHVEYSLSISSLLVLL